MRISLLCLVLVFSLIGWENNAHAITAEDAVLTVGATTAAGLVLSASTLPFYSHPGDHTNNLVFGSVLGAVIGVVIVTYKAINEDVARNASLEPAPEKLYTARSSSLLAAPLSLTERNSGALWTEVATIHF